MPLTCPLLQHGTEVDISQYPLQLKQFQQSAPGAPEDEPLDED
ncbi:hypothetical protein AB5J56_00830 [Streptomyces sp. R21]|uniref:Uncharacterized protein n=1 Tax=Streptomyces sp. R21 TaxID=3238627 RepID=A0AB39NXD1_9ACTN